MQRKCKKLVIFFIVLTLTLVPTSNLNGKVLSPAEKLNELGLLLNITEEDLVQELTREIGLTMIVKALGYTQGEVNAYADMSPFKDTENWAKGWISLAYHLNITTGISETEFSPQTFLTEKEFLTFLLRAIGYESNRAYINVASLSRENGLILENHIIQNGRYTKEKASVAMYNSLSASVVKDNVPLINLLLEKGIVNLNDAINIGLKGSGLEVLRTKILSKYEFQVIFNKPVNTSKFSFTLAKDETVFGVLPFWGASKTSATFTCVDELAAGNYLLNIVFFSPSKVNYTGHFSVSDDQETTLRVYSKGIELKNNPSVKIALLDEFNSPVYNAVFDVTVQNIRTSKFINARIDPDFGYKVVLDNLLDEDVIEGDILELKLSYEKKDLVHQLSVVSKSALDSLELINPVINNERLVQNSRNNILDYIGLALNGESSYLEINSVNHDGKNNIEIIGDYLFVSSNSSIVDVDSFKVDQNGVLRFDIGNAVGITTITATNQKNGSVSSVNIAIYPVPTILRTLIEPVSQVVAVNETVDLNVIAYDQFGAKVNLSFVSGLQYKSSDTSVVSPHDMRLLNNQFSYRGSQEGSTLLSILTKDNILLASVYVDIQEISLPQNIVSVDIPRFFEISDDTEFELSYNHINVVDQYGRRYDLNRNDEKIVISLEENMVENVDLGVGYYSNGSLLIKSKDVEDVGTYRIKLDDIDYSAFLFDIETIESDEIDEYKLEGADEIRMSEDNSIIISLKGYISSGEEVVLSKSKAMYVSRSDDDYYEVRQENNQFTVLGLEEGTASFSIWSDNEIIATKEITVYK